ncbi:MAG: ABC transporter substrate-binding protein [Chloroflexota bacterium]|nr:ABC transporter substrate-binding protein [Chloroflexota bacterium]
MTQRRITVRQRSGALLLGLLLTACSLGPDPTPTAVPSPTAPATRAPATATINAAAPDAPTPLSAWRPGAHRGTVPAPATLLHAGILTVGSDVSGPPPLGYLDKAGTPVGLDMDVAAEIASRLDLQLAVVNHPFDDLIRELNSDQFDLVIAGLTITPEREAILNMVPYFAAGTSLLVQKGNPKGIHSLEDLSGKVVGAYPGSLQERMLRDLNTRLSQAGQAPTRVLPDDAVSRLQAGTLDAILTDSPIAAYYSTVDAATVETPVPPLDPAPEGIATAKHNTALAATVRTVVAAMEQDGTMDAIKAKWGLK